MKILLLSQGRTIADQPDFDAAFRAAKAQDGDVTVHNIPFIGYIAEHGENAFYEEVLRVNFEFNPDVVFFQFFHGSKTGGVSACVNSLKNSENKPLVFLSCGDLFDVSRFGRWGRIPEWGMMEVAKEADAFFVTSMGEIADYYASIGVKNIIFLPNAYCDCHFGIQDSIPNPESVIYDVAMVSSVGISRYRPVGTLIHTLDRASDAYRLSKRYGAKFALWGHGWHGFFGCKGNLSFKNQVRTFRSSRIVVDARPPLAMRYYTSDRAFFIAGSGTSLIMFAIPGFDKIFKPNRHAYYVDTPSDLVNVCQSVLAHPQDELVENIRDTMHLIRSRHLISHRVDTIISTAEALLKHRRGEISKDAALRAIRMWHFLPEANLEEEYQHCVANWVG